MCDADDAETASGPMAWPDIPTAATQWGPGTCRSRFSASICSPDGER
jgi:hypothetical protein